MRMQSDKLASKSRWPNRVSAPSSPSTLRCEADTARAQALSSELSSDPSSAVSGAAGAVSPAALHARLRQLALNVLASRESNTAKLQSRLLKAGKAYYAAHAGNEQKRDMRGLARTAPAGQDPSNATKAHPAAKPRSFTPIAPLEAEALALLQNTVERVLVELTESGYLSDQRYTDLRTRSLLQRGKGRFAIAQQLALDGIDKTQRQVSLQALDADIDWRAQALALLQRKFAKLDFSQAASRAKVQRFLLSRGFDSASVRFALQHAGAATDMEFDI